MPDINDMSEMPEMPEVNDTPEMNSTLSDPLAPAEAAAVLSAPPEVVARRRGNPFAFPIAILGWIVPGLGHLVLGRWGRALTIFVSVGGLAVAGSLMRGELFFPHSYDPLSRIGFFADASSGVFYFASRFLDVAGSDVSRAAGDYGTRFLAAAGIVNLLGVFDAYEIASRRRG